LPKSGSCTSARKQFPNASKATDGVKPPKFPGRPSTTVQVAPLSRLKARIAAGRESEEAVPPRDAKTIVSGSVGSTATEVPNWLSGAWLTLTLGPTTPPATPANAMSSAGRSGFPPSSALLSGQAATSRPETKSTPIASPRKSSVDVPELIRKFGAAAAGAPAVRPSAAAAREAGSRANTYRAIRRASRFGFHRVAQQDACLSSAKRLLGELSTSGRIAGT
jgi:hypothetical protein